MKLHKIENYIGKKIYHLTVEKKVENQTGKNSNKWLFICECGNKIICNPCQVINGQVRSCGCAKNNGSKLTNSKYYDTWHQMKYRCYNEKAYNYHLYGGRGIKVCKEWQDIIGFVKWAEKTCPNKNRDITLDRIDVNGDYCPENCRWVSMKEQNRNRRNTRYETIDGITKPLIEFCEDYNIDYNTVLRRINRFHWDVITALTTPVGETKFGKGGGVFLEIDGVKKNINEWSNEYGILSSTISKRLKMGWSPEKAVKYPSNRKKKSKFTLEFESQAGSQPAPN